MSQAIGRGGVGNIRSSSRARATSHAPEGATQTASIINEINESNAEYERIVIQTSEDAAKNVVSHRTPLCLIFIFICPSSCFLFYKYCVPCLATSVPVFSLPFPFSRAPIDMILTCAAQVWPWRRGQHQDRSACIPRSCSLRGRASDWPWRERQHHARLAP